MDIEVLADQPPVITDSDSALVKLVIAIIEQDSASKILQVVSNSAEMGRFTDPEDQVQSVILGPKIINDVYQQADSQLVDIYGEVAHKFLQ